MANELPFIVDVSKHQSIIDPPRPTKHIDWQTMKDKGVEVAAIRCTVGDYYEDQEFHYNYESALDNYIYPTPYIVNTPENKADEQIKKFSKYWGDYKLYWPPVLDCELDRGQNPQAITANIEKCLKLLEDKFGVAPIIYTRKSWWDVYVLKSSKWRNYPGWFAWYPYDLEYSLVFPKAYCPRDWIIDGEPKWTIWQKWADQCGKGREYGAWSSGLDLSWYNGAKDEFIKKFLMPEVQPEPEPEPDPEPEPEPQKTLEQRVDIIEREAIKEGWNLS